jgi:CheY-like chemotaxis protein
MFQSNKAVLIVEDEPMIRMVTADALADRGIYQVASGARTAPLKEVMRERN